MSETFEPNPPAKKSMGPLPYILIGCGGVFFLMILACGGFLYWGYTQAASIVSPEVERLFAAMNDGTAADIYENETSSSFRASVDARQFERLADAVKEQLGPLESKSAQGFNMQTSDEGAFAEVTYDATFANGDATVKVRYLMQGERRLLDELDIQSAQLTANLSAGRCPNCNTALTAADKFCPNCGQPVEGADAPATGKGANPDAVPADEPATDADRDAGNEGDAGTGDDTSSTTSLKLNAP